MTNAMTGAVIAGCALRELPFGARQRAAAVKITLERITERLCPVE
jgi:hypothetical protein